MHTHKHTQVHSCIHTHTDRHTDRQGLSNEQPNLLVLCSCLSIELQCFFGGLELPVIEQVGTYHDTGSPLQRKGGRRKWKGEKVKEKRKEGKGVNRRKEDS